MTTTATQHTNGCPSHAGGYCDCNAEIMEGRDAAAGAPAASARITFLKKKREVCKQDLLLKFEDSDFHGVQDAASDLRDIDAELKGLGF